MAGTKLGTAYVDVQPDFTSLTTQMGAFFAGSKWKSFGKAAGVVGGIGVAAGAAGKALFDLGVEFDAAYDKIRTQTGATEKQMGRLEKSFKKVVQGVPTDFESASDAVAGLNQRLELTGRPLVSLSKQILELSRVTGTDAADNVRSLTRLFGDWSIKTKDQKDTLDGLFRLSQETGVAVGELSDAMVQFGSPLRTLGLDFDFTAAMLSRFEEEGVNASTILSGLRFSVGSLSDRTPELTERFKELGIRAKEPADAIAEVFRKIEDVKTSAGNSLAIEVFGRRAGPDMAAAVREGRLELDELMKTFNRGEGTIREAGRDTMDFSEHWQKFSNRLKVMVEPVAIAVFDAVGKGMKALSKIDLGAVIQDLKDFWKEAGVLRDVVQAVGKFITERMGGMVDAVKQSVRFIAGILTGDFGKAWDAVKGLFKAGVRLALAPLRAMIGLAKSIGGRVADALKGVLGGVWDWIKGAWEDGLNWLIGLVNKIIGVINKIPGVDIGTVGGVGGDDGGNAAGGPGSGTDPGRPGNDRVANNKFSGSMPGAAIAKHYSGGKVTTPTAIVGEEAPRHPEYVLATNPRYRDRNRELWMAAGHDLGIPGFALGGLIPPIAGAAPTQTANDYIGKLPGPGGGPKFLRGVGEYVLDAATSWIRDKVKDAVSATAGAITGGMTKDLKGTTTELAAILCDKFGLTVSSGYRSPAANDAAGGAPNSSHMRGTPENPGAHDFVPPTGAPGTVGVAGAYALNELGAIWADNHDYGSGLHQHVSWFARGGKRGGTGREAEQIGRALPSVLQPYNHVWGAHVAPDYGGPTMPVDKIAMLAEFFGMPGVTFAQIAKGESAYRPGAVGVDPGGTRGYGLWQITNRASGMDSVVARFGGYGQMLNPIKNAIIAAKMWKARGTSPWFGTQYMTGTNLHWSGDFGDTERLGGGGGDGGAGARGANRGQDRKPPRQPPGSATWEPEPPMGQSYAEAPSLPQKLRELIKGLRAQTPGLQELLDSATTRAGWGSSPDGTDMSAGERSELITLAEALLMNLYGRRDAIRKGLGKLNSRTPAYANLAAELAELEGVTGTGGEILVALTTLEDLRGGQGALDQAQREANLTIMNEALANQLATAMQNNRLIASQAPVFAEMFRRVPFGGSFADGGVVPGAPGVPVGIIAHGQETVIPEGGLNVTVVVKDGAVNSDAIEVVVNDRLAQVARASSPVGGNIGQRVRRG